MSVVLFVLFFVSAATAVAFFVAMFVKRNSLYGVVGVCVLAGPAPLLAFGYIIAASG